MLGKAPTRVVSLALAFGVVFAMPLAGAFGMGVDSTSVTTMKNAGAPPAYGQTWVGKWIKTSGWGSFESQLRTMRDSGVTPVIQWYYWGDDISPNCVKYGCEGRTKGEWDAMAKELATRAKNVMGTRTFYVVVEPEFQKNGIEDWETFDGYLENQANLIKGAAPSAKIVTGFGHWGNWDLFDRAVAASDMVGFQVLRGSTRDTKEKAVATADYMISLTKQLKARWGKSVMVYDLGISTYGGWESTQEQALKNVIAKRAALDEAGVKAIVWRYVNDNSLSKGYFGEAEKYWGVKRTDGSKKPAYDELIALLKGSSTSTTSTTTSGTTTTSTFSASFSGVKIEEWWVQTSVSSSASIAKVEVQLNDGAWQALTKQSWGGWAKSTNIPTGTKVEFRATSSTGATSTSAPYYR